MVYPIDITLLIFNHEVSASLTKRGRSPSAGQDETKKRRVEVINALPSEGNISLCSLVAAMTYSPSLK
jgi:hypothetical protein